ncbi:MAG: SMI1/KNR4 family protein [Saprospiraceae bacterium]
MKNLEILPKITKSEIKDLESILECKFNEELIIFFQKYLDSKTKECYYISVTGDEWELSKFSNYTIMYKNLIKYIEKNNLKLLIFGFDPGGWNFCLSFEKKDMFKVIVDRTENDDPEEQFVVIADSFEDFINGLQERPNNLL